MATRVPRKRGPGSRWTAEDSVNLRRLRDRGFSVAQIELLHPGGYSASMYITKIRDLGLQHDPSELAIGAESMIQAARLRRARIWMRMQDEMERALDEIQDATEGGSYKVVRRGPGGSESEATVTTGLTIHDKVVMIAALKHFSVMEGSFSKLQTPSEQRADVNHARYAESFMRVMSVALASANLSPEQRALATEAIVRELEAEKGGEHAGGVADGPGETIEGSAFSGDALEGPG